MKFLKMVFKTFSSTTRKPRTAKICYIHLRKTTRKLVEIYGQHIFENYGKSPYYFCWFRTLKKKHGFVKIGKIHMTQKRRKNGKYYFRGIYSSFPLSHFYNSAPGALIDHFLLPSFLCILFLLLFSLFHLLFFVLPNVILKPLSPPLYVSVLEFQKLTDNCRKITFLSAPFWFFAISLFCHKKIILFRIFGLTSKSLERKIEFQEAYSFSEVIFVNFAALGGQVLEKKVPFWKFSAKIDFCKFPFHSWSAHFVMQFSWFLSIFRNFPNF